MFLSAGMSMAPNQGIFELNGPLRSGLDPSEYLRMTIFYDGRLWRRGSVLAMMSLTPVWLKPLKPSLRSRFSRCEPIAPEVRKVWACSGVI